MPLATVTPETAARDAASSYPLTEEGWSARYEMLWQAYVGGDYTADMVKVWHLFRAVDDAGDEIDATYRVTRDFQFLCNIYAASVAGISPGPVLEDIDPSEEDYPTAAAYEAEEARREATMALGEAVWRRSRVLSRVGGWAKVCAALGDGYWEPVRMSETVPHRTTLVWRDPRNCRVYYDATGTIIERAVVEVEVPDTTPMEGAGVSTTPRMIRVRRELTQERIDVYRDGAHVPAESGIHKCGCVPIAHAVWSSWTEPEHGLPVGHPIDKALAMIDSVMCMARAVGNRHAAPILTLSGAKLGTGANSVGKVGRVYHGLPTGAKLDTIEPTMDGVGRMLEVARSIWEHIRMTEPAYIFSDSAGTESGEAKGYRSAAFEAAVHDIRARFYGALLEATEMAVCMDTDTMYDPDACYLTVDLPPVLPRNVGADVKSYVDVRADLHPDDRVRFLQRIGMIPPDEDPTEYAAELADMTGDAPMVDGAGGDMATRGAELETMAGDLTAIVAGLETMAGQMPEHAATLRALAARVSAARDVASPGSASDNEPAAPNGTANTTALPATQAGVSTSDIKDQALNGAQVASMVQVVQSVASGMLPRDSALAILQSAYALTLAEAEEILATAGAGFKIAPRA